jgi:hypothetical protein
VLGLEVGHNLFNIHVNQIRFRLIHVRMTLRS